MHDLIIAHFSVFSRLFISHRAERSPRSRLISPPDWARVYDYFAKKLILKFADNQQVIKFQENNGQCVIYSNFDFGNHDRNADFSSVLKDDPKFLGLLLQSSTLQDTEIKQLGEGKPFSLTIEVLTMDEHDNRLQAMTAKGNAEDDNEGSKSDIAAGAS